MVRSAADRAADPAGWDFRYQRGLEIKADIDRRRGIAARLPSIDRELARLRGPFVWKNHFAPNHNTLGRVK